MRSAQGMSEQASACADAPIFRPSASEWADPFEYIRSVSAKVNEFGIARIVPPPDWKPPFALDAARLRLRVATQRTSDLSERDYSRQQFMKCPAPPLHTAPGRKERQTAALGGDTNGPGFMGEFVEFL